MGDASFGKYRLLAELGHGGMADVFLAVVAGPAGSGFSKLTVIKRLRSNLAEDREFVAMLVDEARISARLNHPNVVQTNEVGEVNGRYFIAMEYLDGQPLHRIQFRIAQAPEAVPVTKAMQYLVIAEALAGLHHAHELTDYDGTPLQIVHRDMTPQNVFVTYEGQVKVVDFGIAKATGRASETKQGVVKGKVRYMAPEQAIGRRLDRRADVFAAGIMLWEAATGARMWKGKDDLEILARLLGGDTPPPPRTIDPSVPEAIDRICIKALAFRPEDRFSTAEEFRLEIEQYLADSGQIVEARRKLGAAVTETFADKRAELKQIIDDQLRELSNTQSGEFQTTFIPLESTSIPASAPSRPVTISSHASSFVNSDPNDETKAVSTASNSLPPQPRRNAGRAAAIGITIGLLAAAVGVTATLVSRSAAKSAAAAAAAQEQVDVSITVEPTSAQIKLDDRPVGNAFESRVLRDGKEHRVEVSADGFVTKTETLSFSGPVKRTIRLERAERAEAPPAAPASPGGPHTAAAGTGASRTPPPGPAWRPTGRPTTAPPPTTATPAPAPPPPAPDPPAATSGHRTTPDPNPTSRKKREIDKSDPFDH